MKPCKKITAFILCFIFTVSCPVSSLSAGERNVIKRVASEDKRIALTFDDGPHYKYTEEILDILGQYGIKATFFVIGENAAMRKRIIERELSEGHEIGNHTFSHVYLKGIDEKSITDEITKTENEISAVNDYKPRLLRPPGGLYDDKLPTEAENMGYKIVLWSIDTRDWSHPASSEIVSEVMTNVKGGDIILMHDFIGGAASPTPEALRELIPLLIQSGYEFVTVSELISQ